MCILQWTDEVLQSCSLASFMWQWHPLLHVYRITFSPSLIRLCLFINSIKVQSHQRIIFLEMSVYFPLNFIFFPRAGYPHHPGHLVGCVCEPGAGWAAIPNQPSITPGHSVTIGTCRCPGLDWSGPAWRVQLSSADKLTQIYPSFVNWPWWNWENGFQSVVIKSTQIRRCQLRKDQKPVWPHLTSNPWEESRKEQVWWIEMLDCILFK